MNFFDIFFTGIALSMDAVAVGMANGMSNPTMSKKRIFWIALVFGVFQAGMPLIGYFFAKIVVSASENFFQKISGWIAFVLLALIGGKMIVDGIKEMISGSSKTEATKAATFLREEENAMKEKEKSEASRFFIGTLLWQGVATSMDALAVGISMRMTEISSYLRPSIGFAAAIIGATTFLLSAASVAIGKKLGDKLADKAQVIGGVVLFAIGIKCLLEGIL